MSIFDDVRTALVSRVSNFLMPDEMLDAANRTRLMHLAELQVYYDGAQRQALRVKQGQFNDNLTVNIVALIVDKAVSALMGDPSAGRGVEFKFESETEGNKEGEEEPEHIRWLEQQWEMNHKDIFLHLLGLSGAESGFPAVKLVPDGKGNVRLLNQNALLLRVTTKPNDYSTIVRYTLRYNVKEGKDEVGYREITEPKNQDDFTAGWTVKLDKRTKGEWNTISTTDWQYPFAPYLCWQNLPALNSVYGKSDIEDIIPIQDRLNFVESNASKIIRLFAHPQRYSVNLSGQPSTGTDAIEFGPDTMPAYQTTSELPGRIEQLAQVSDLPGVMAYLDHLHDSAFEIAREVNWTRKDLAGYVTNFGMRILCKDMLDKLGTKRMLYGEALRELNRRMLILGGKPEELCEVEFPDPLPENEVEAAQALKADMEAGLVSKQTVSEKRGYDWQQEKDRLALEKQAGDNVGGALLEEFFRKGGSTRRAPVLPAATAQIQREE